MYMTFDITEPRWCLYLKNLLLFLFINLQKKSKTFAITMSPLNGFCFEFTYHRSRNLFPHTPLPLVYSLGWWLAVDS